MRKALIFSFFALAIAACGGGDDDVVEIRMLDNSFAPTVVEVEVGQTIRFVNDGNVGHNAVAYDESWSTIELTGSELMQPGDTVEITFDEPGVYQYRCTPHSVQGADGEWQGMIATIIVGDVTDSASAVGATSSAPAEWTGVTRHVPDDYPTIQSAVDAADPGDLILIQPGVYKEAVSVTTPGLVIRGVDRNKVILDGEYTRDNGIAVVADGVAIENMTAIGYTVNDFFWNGVTGFRASYLTAIDGWVYGIYSFDAADGLYEHSYASGSWDAGFYIGQCDPCNTVLTDLLAEFNGLGFSGTNASGNTYVVNSEWRYNVAGVVPNSLDSELLAPVHDFTVAGNYIHHNGEIGRAPSRTSEWSGYGNGIILAGNQNSEVYNNLLVNNATSGIQVVSMLDKSLWPSKGNHVHDNVILGSGRSDLALGGPVEQGSCFEDNEASTTLPYFLQFFHSCDGLNLPMPYGLAVGSDALGRIAQAKAGQNPQLEHGEAPMPELDFPQMPGGADAPVRPAVNVFASLNFDPDSIRTPELPADVEIADRRPVILGVAVDGGFWPVWMGALLWWVPLGVYAIGGVWALRNLWRSDRRGKVVWTVVIVLVPVLGLLAYVFFGDRRLRRILWSAGGIVVWLAAVIASTLIGGIL